MLERTWYAGTGWRMCLARGCGVRDTDWGADVLTDALAFRWRTTHDPALVPYLRALVAAAPLHGAPCTTRRCREWSDIPEWDAVAGARAYEATGDAAALEKARAAFRSVEASPVYALGACPRILYQQPYGERDRLKTLETDSNGILAALLLYRATREPAYLESARARYAAVRRRFLDPAVPLYTTYVFDDGRTCTPVGHRFYASVNGNMIAAALGLYDATGERAYWTDAVDVGRAVDEYLADGRRVFVDLQAENDVVEPLVEAMYALAVHGGQRFAARWILRNAQAALGARTPDGYGRFFDGPPPAGPLSAWQTNGGFALMIAAAALPPQPQDVPHAQGWWHDAAYVARDVPGLPATIRFTGSGIALLGTLGERCCEPGHARVFVDGEETFDHRGIWQNKSSAQRPLPGAVLFAWRWDRPGPHTLEILPGRENAKEGGPFLHLRGYLVK